MNLTTAMIYISPAYPLYMGWAMFSFSEQDWISLEISLELYKMLRRGWK